MSRPDQTISVIIPVYNGEAYLADAVASVQAQSLPASEIIVVDDGSTDRTPYVIASLGRDIRSIRQANRGPAAARNCGLEMARGALVAFIDSDDLWSKGKIESQVHRLSSDPSLQLVLGATQRVQQADSQRAGTNPVLVPVGPVWMLFHLGAALFRRTAFDTVGTFDESLHMGEDVDWFLRAREAGIEMGISNEVVLQYRQHDTNLTGDAREKDRFFLSALKRSLDRRRADTKKAAELAPIRGLADFDPERGGAPS